MRHRLLLIFQGFDDSFHVPQFAEGITLTSVPDWCLEGEGLLHAFPVEHRRLQHNTTRALQLDYEAPGLNDMWPTFRPKLIDAYLAMTIAGYPIAGYHLLIDGTERASQAWEVRAIGQLLTFSFDLQLPDDECMKAASLAEPLHSQISKVPQGALRLALDTLILSFGAQHGAIRLLLYWIALEALFSPDSPGENTHQMAERYAWVMGNDSQSRRDLHRKVKDLYGVRCDIAHGRQRDLKPSKQHQNLVESYELLIAALLRILSNVKLCDAFSSKNKEIFLKGCTFG